MKVGARQHLIAILCGLGGGFLFAVIQFGLCETAFQIGQVTDRQAFYDLSDAIAWPAGPLYERIDVGRNREILERLVEKGAPGSETAAELLPELDENLYGEDSEWSNAYWALQDEYDLPLSMPIWLDYLIYGGVCLAWGAVVAVALYGGVLLLLLLVSDPSPS